MNELERYFCNSGIVLVFLLAVLSAIGLLVYGYNMCLYPLVVFGLLSLLIRPYWKKTGTDK